MTTRHYHYMNGSTGCLPDSSDVYTRRRDAIEWAEQLFGDSLCSKCFAEMSKALRAQRSALGVVCYFDSHCENESPSGGTCSAGADYVSIQPERGGVRYDKHGDLVGCACG